jgi:hypothetical protein
MARRLHYRRDADVRVREPWGGRERRPMLKPESAGNNCGRTVHPDPELDGYTDQLRCVADLIPNQSGCRSPCGYLAATFEQPIRRSR